MKYHPNAMLDAMLAIPVYRRGGHAGANRKTVFMRSRLRAHATLLMQPSEGAIGTGVTRLKSDSANECRWPPDNSQVLFRASSGSQGDRMGRVQSRQRKTG